MYDYLIDEKVLLASRKAWEQPIFLDEVLVATDLLPGRLGDNGVLAGTTS